jgi:hypothetical protein
MAVGKHLLPQYTDHKGIVGGELHHLASDYNARLRGHFQTTARSYQFQKFEFN